MYCIIENQVRLQTTSVIVYELTHNAEIINIVGKIMFIIPVMVFHRILELKSHLETLESSRIQFIGHGLIQVHHTVCDVEMKAIPKEPGRPQYIQDELDKILARVKEKKETVVTIGKMISNMN